MKSLGMLSLLCGAAMFASCSRVHQEDPRLYARVAELEDSLKAYRDSLRAVQLAWSFNYVTAIVKLQNDEVRLGDSCRFQVFIGAANSPDASLGYRYSPARLELEGLEEARVEKQGMSWIVSFKPEKLGSDSVSGTLWVDNVRSGPTDLMFTTYYDVVK
ncbi:MAG: hypothetical protein WAR83_14860 [Flavobacteriales bacterium]